MRIAVGRLLLMFPIWHLTRIWNPSVSQSSAIVTSHGRQVSLQALLQVFGHKCHGRRTWREARRA